MAKSANIFFHHLIKQFLTNIFFIADWVEDMLGYASYKGFFNKNILVPSTWRRNEVIIIFEHPTVTPCVNKKIKKSSNIDFGRHLQCTSLLVRLWRKKKTFCNRTHKSVTTSETNTTIPYVYVHAAAKKHTL